MKVGVGVPTSIAASSPEVIGQSRRRPNRDCYEGQRHQQANASWVDHGSPLLPVDHVVPPQLDGRRWGPPRTFCQPVRPVPLRAVRPDAPTTYEAKTSAPFTGCPRCDRRAPREVLEHVGDAAGLRAQGPALVARGIRDGKTGYLGATIPLLSEMLGESDVIRVPSDGGATCRRSPAPHSGCEAYRLASSPWGPSGTYENAPAAASQPRRPERKASMNSTPKASTPFSRSAASR